MALASGLLHSSGQRRLVITDCSTLATATAAPLDLKKRAPRISAPTFPSMLAASAGRCVKNRIIMLRG